MSSSAGKPYATEAIRADIEETRAELGDTAEELAARADVKARAQQKAAEVKNDAAAVFRRRPLPVAGIAAVLAAGAGALVFLRRRAAKRRAPRSWWQR